MTTFNPYAKVSKYFRWGDLTVTAQKAPNIPNAAAQKQLIRLAALLDRIRDEVGDFYLLSAYRSPQVQAILKTKEAAASAKTSFHELGMAADIVPKTMTLRQMWALIAIKPWARQLIGELALKEPQKAIHVSLQGSKGFTPLDQLPNKSYVKMSAEKISELAQSVGQRLSEIKTGATSFIKKQPVLSGAAISILALVIGVSIILFTHKQEDKK
jgi:hypothetical protein